MGEHLNNPPKKRMNMRRLARERAIQFLYQEDLNSEKDVAEALKSFWEILQMDPLYNDKAKATWAEKVEIPPLTPNDLAAMDFMESLVKGVIEHREEIDEMIVKYAKNWNLGRMAVIDRNILRLAAYEMMFRGDIPPVVSINEAVDIAKKYSTDDSGKFVNGILDQIRTNILRPSR